jgi:hypothetical protein
VDRCWEPIVRRAWSLSCGLLLLAAAPTASAQSSEADTATARKLGEQGFVAFDAKDYAKAAELFARAEQLHHAPTLLVGLARAQAALGRFVEAQESYQRVLREKLPADANDAYKQAVTDADTELTRVEKQIAWVTIRVAGPAGAQVLVDGVALPPAAVGVSRAFNPGQHTAVARASGVADAEQRFSAEPGSQQTLELKLGPGTGTSSAGAEPSTDAAGADKNQTGAAMRTAGFVSIGVGAAGLVVGAITGILAVTDHSELVDSCPNERCPEPERSTLDRYNIVNPISTAGLVAGGVLAATGLVLVLVAPSGEPDSPAPAAAPGTASLLLGVGPGSAALTLRY